MNDAQGAWTLPEVALLVFGSLLLLWQPTFFLNDELAQALGLRTLAGGSMVTEFVPLSYQGYFGSLFGQYSLQDVLYGDVVLAGSWMENILALPVRFLLAGLSAPFGLGAALGLVAGAGIGAAAWVLTRRRMRPERATWLGLGIAAVLALGAPRQVASQFLDVAALQLVTFAATAFAAALWWHMLRPQGPRLAWFGALLLVAGTPMMFWAFQIKYHGLALALSSMAIWCYREGASTPPLRTLAAAGVVGLAVWNHQPSGLFLGAALLVAALPAVRHPGFWAKAGAGGGGVLFGIVPWWLQGWATRKSLRIAAAEGTSGAVGASGGPSSEFLPGATYAGDSVVYGGFLDHAVWNDPLGALGALWQTYVWTDWFQVGAALSVLPWAPWTILAVVTLARCDLRARVPLWPAAVFIALAMPLVVGERLLDMGAGFDMRHAVTVWPWLVLLSWPALAHLLRARPTRWWTEQAVVAAVVGMSLLLLVNLLWHKSTGLDLVQKGFSFEGTWLHRTAGITLAAALTAAMAAVRWRGSRWSNARDRVLAWSLASSLTFGTWLRLAAAAPEFEHQSAPFVVWPTRILAAALRWMGYSY